MNEQFESIKDAAGNLAQRIGDMYESFTQSDKMQQIKADVDQTGKLIQQGISRLSDDIKEGRMGDNIRQAAEHTTKSVEQAVDQLKSEYKSGELQQQIEQAGKDTVATIRQAAGEAREGIESGKAADAAQQAYQKMGDAVQHFRERISALRK